MTTYFYSRNAQLATLAVLAIGLVLVWGLLVREEQAIAADSTDRLDTEKLVLRQMEAESARARGNLARYRANLREMEKYRASFLENKAARLVAISSFLDETTRARGVLKERVGYQIARGRSDDLDIYQISMPVEGRYRDIRALISDIESSDLYLCISQLALEDLSGGRGTVSMQLGLETFFQGGSR